MIAIVLLFGGSDSSQAEIASTHDLRGETLYMLTVVKWRKFLRHYFYFRFRNQVEQVDEEELEIKNLLEMYLDLTRLVSISVSITFSIR